MMKNQFKSYNSLWVALGFFLLLSIALPASGDEEAETFITSASPKEESGAKWNFLWTYYQIPLATKIPGYYSELVVEFGYSLAPWAEIIAILPANQPFAGKNEEGSPSYGLGDAELGFEFPLFETKKISVTGNVMTMFPTSQDSRDTSYQGSLDGGIEWRWFPGHQKIFSLGTTHQAWFNSYDRPTTEEHGGEPNYDSELYNKIVFILKPSKHLILSQNFGYHLHRSVEGDTSYSQSTRSKVAVPINSALSFFTFVNWEDEVGADQGYLNEEATTFGMGLGAIF